MNLYDCVITSDKIKPQKRIDVIELIKEMEEHERKRNMDNLEITVKLNGELVPLSTVSDETIQKIKAGEQKEPIFGIDRHRQRLLVKLTPRVIATLQLILDSKHIHNRYVSICPDGNYGMLKMGTTWEKAKRQYSNAQAKPLFEEK